MNTWAALAVFVVMTFAAAFAVDDGNTRLATSIMALLVVAFQLAQVAQNNVLIELLEKLLSEDEQQGGGR